MISETQYPTITSTSTLSLVNHTAIKVLCADVLTEFKTIVFQLTVKPSVVNSNMYVQVDSSGVLNSAGEYTLV